jgi:hypothetical protein
MESLPVSPDKDSQIHFIPPPVDPTERPIKAVATNKTESSAETQMRVLLMEGDLSFTVLALLCVP